MPYAPKVQTIHVNETIPMVCIKELTIFLINGTVVPPNAENKDVKFCNVGFFTKNFGGKMNSSFSGLNAEFIT